MNYRELKEDEYYVGEWDGNKKCIFIHSRYKETPGIDTTNIFSFDKIWCSGGNINFRTPTLEEKHWLDVCIKENKSIPYEEAFKTFKQNVQTNEEYILEEAKIKYPIGTKFYPIFGNISKILTITDNNFTFHNNNTSITVSTNLGNGSIVKNGCSIYHNGKWAEIIELPKEQTEFKKGDYIVYTEDSDNDGFRFNYCYKQKQNEKYLCPEITDKGSVNNGWSYINIIKDNWRYATLKEIAEYDRIGKPYDVTTLNQKELSMEEIQEECKRKFPIGCTFVNTNKDGGKQILVEDEYVYKIVNKNIWAGANQGCLYSNGVYAELILLPKIKEEIPEYVEYIDTKYKGKIVKIEDWKCGSYCKVLFADGKKEQPFKHLVKPSTKEAYEAQNFKIKSEDAEIKVGDYIQYLNEGFYTVESDNPVYLFHHSDNTSNAYCKDLKYLNNLKKFKKVDKDIITTENFKQNMGLKPSNFNIEVGDEVECIKSNGGPGYGFKLGLKFIVRSIRNCGSEKCYFGGNRGGGVYQSHLKLIKKHSNTTIKEQVDVSSPKVTNEITIPKINTKTLDRLLHINAEIKTTMVTVPKIEVKKSVIKNIQVNVLKSLTI